MPSRQRVLDFVHLVEHWDVRRAFEEFYAADVVTQKNQSPPTVGRADGAERSFVKCASLARENRAVGVVVHGDDVTILWNAELTTPDGQRLRLDQRAVQRWQGDRIVQERYVAERRAVTGA
jgi:ketosteroid isomerase-like protein